MICSMCPQDAWPGSLYPIGFSITNMLWPSLIVSWRQDSQSMSFHVVPSLHGSPCEVPSPLET